MITNPPQPQTPPSTAADRHLDHLDGLRALAALFVVLHHSWLTVWPTIYNREPHGLARPLTWVFLYGHFAVAVFIVLSGFCLMLPVVAHDGVLKGGALHFFKKRARRILPPYYLSIAFSTLVIVTLIKHRTGTHFDMCIPLTFHAYWTHLLLLQDVFGDPGINHALWSVAVEWHIYFLFPLLLIAWRKWGGPWATFLTMAAGYIIYFAIRRTSYGGITPHFLALFALGMLGAAIATSTADQWKRLRENVPWYPVAAVTFAMVIGFCAYSPWEKAFRQFPLLDLIGSVGVVGLLVATTTNPVDKLRNLLSTKPLVWCGRFAYSIYLIHAVIVQAVYQHLVMPFGLPDWQAFLALILTVTPATIAVSYLFFLGCERPFLTPKLKRAQLPS